MEILDFQNCYMLESEIFLTLADCKIKHLYLQGCENIYFRRARQLEKGNKDSKLPEEEIFEMETIKHPIKKEMVIVREKKPDHIITLNRPGLRIVERRYILDMHSVTYGLKHLVSNGAERIRLEGVLVGSKTQLKKGAQENERLKIVNLENCVYQAIYLSVYPIIAYWANPKSFARDIKLYFGEDKSFNGIPQVKTS